MRGTERTVAGMPWLDVVAGLLLGAAAAVSTALQLPAGHPVAEVLAAVSGASLMLRRSSPLGMVIIASVGIGCYSFIPGAVNPLWSFAAVLLITFSAFEQLAGWRALVCGGLLLASAYLLQVATDSLVVERVISPGLVVGLPALAGVSVRRWREQTDRLRQLTAELAAEQDKTAAAAAQAERSRIAREMHDVIAHSVSVMIVQSGAALGMMGADHPAHEPVQAVRAAGREALAELRRLLSVLREGDADTPSPQPGVDQITELVHRAGAELRVVGEPVPVPAGLGLAVYRIVQEALTNSRRHAPGRRATVEIGYREKRLEVTVVDEGGVGVASRSAGHGLIGMRERAEMYGGDLTVGPREDAGGWQVRALLPLTGAGQ